MIHPFYCQLCGQRFTPKNLKSFSGSMRRHRKSKHPDHVGSIKYSIEPPKEK